MADVTGWDILGQGNAIQSNRVSSWLDTMFLQGLTSILSEFRSRKGHAGLYVFKTFMQFN